MKKFRFLLIFFGALLVSFSYLAKTEESDAARIHVIANSNTPADQSVKMKVVEEIKGLLSDGEYSSLDSLENALRDTIPEIERQALLVLSENGFDYGARASVGVSHYEERALGGSLFPEGDYLALKVVLGEGKGENWWSVLFPDVAFSASLARGESGREGKRVVLGDGRVVKIRCLISEIFSDVIEGRFF